MSRYQFALEMHNRIHNIRTGAQRPEYRTSRFQDLARQAQWNYQSMEEYLSEWRQTCQYLLSIVEGASSHLGILIRYRENNHDDFEVIYNRTLMFNLWLLLIAMEGEARQMNEPDLADGLREKYTVVVYPSGDIGNFSYGGFDDDYDESETWGNFMSGRRFVNNRTQSCKAYVRLRMGLAAFVKKDRRKLKKAIGNLLKAKIIIHSEYDESILGSAINLATSSGLGKPWLQVDDSASQD